MFSSILILTLDKVMIKKLVHYFVHIRVIGSGICFNHFIIQKTNFNYLFFVESTYLLL